MRTIGNVGMCFMAGVLLAGCADLEGGDEGEAALVDKGGYVGEDAPQDISAPPPSTGRSIPARSDFVVAVTPYSGVWGSWSAMQYCPEGSYAGGYSERIEGSQGSGDDTGLNAIAVECVNKATGAWTDTLTPHAGFWGSWSQTRRCSVQGGFFTGSDLKFERPQGSGDDTAANAVDFYCNVGQAFGPARGWGEWQPKASCPANTAVCGIQVRVEGTQGSGDDTAFNGLNIACCRF